MSVLGVIAVLFVGSLITGVSFVCGWKLHAFVVQTLGLQAVNAMGSLAGILNSIDGIGDTAYAGRGRRSNSKDKGEPATPAEVLEAVGLGDYLTGLRYTHEPEEERRQV